MSLRVRLLALVAVLAVAMTVVAFLLPHLALESAGAMVWKERREVAEAGLRREWTRAIRDLAVTGTVLERAIDASSPAVTAQHLERAIQASGASRGWVRPMRSPSVVEQGESLNFRQAADLAPLLATARNAGRAAGLVFHGPRAAWVEIVAVPGTDALGALELSIDSRLARRFADSVGVEIALAGVPAAGNGLLRLGSDSTAGQHLLLYEVAGAADVRRRATDTGDAADSVRLVRLESLDDMALVGAIAARDIGAGALFEEFRLIMALALGSIALGGILAVGFAAGSLRKGIIALDRAARELIAGRGQYEPVIRSGRDELARLSSTFNTMHEAVRQREQRIRQAAYRDPVTRLPTRVLFDERGGAMLAWVRAKDRKVSLMLLQVDQLREINDTLGRQAAEQVLAELAERFRGVLRGTRMLTGDDKSEPRELSILARTGPYEFAVMLRDCDPVTARNVGLRLADMASRPFRHEGQTLGIALRVGVAGYPVHGATIPDLMQSADYALVGAAAEIGGVAIFDPAFEAERERQLAVQADLRIALDRRELHMVFQPKISLGGGSELMAEALMRWVHPERGPQNPAEFVEFAEKTGFISKLTAWAIDGALRHAAEWSRGGLPMTISVNLSRRDLMNPEFPAQVIAALRQHGLSGTALSFDIPDGVLLGAPAIVTRNMELLSRAGAMFAVDDFGSGFGSIDELQKLPLHSLKIDRRYVGAMCEDPRAAIIVRAVIDIARSMGLESVAEGVETAEQLAMLREMGCDQAQGYYVGRPLTREDFEVWVRHQAAKYGVQGADRRLRPRMAHALAELDAVETIVVSSVDDGKA